MDVRCGTSRKGSLTAALLLAATVAGCAGTPFRYQAQTEIPEGPGLFTGERGALQLAGGGQPQAPARADGGASIGERFSEFELYLEYRRAKSERSAAYREFLEWIEWRRYREWKARGSQPGR
jgi:hypothetical protein